MTTTVNEITSAPLKWHGGKSYLAARIIAMMPPHLHYVEPYFGGGAVMLAKNPEGVSEVANDLNRGLSDFWQAMQGEGSFERFKRIIDAMPFSELEFDKAKLHGEHYYGPDSIGRAVDFFVRCRQSMSGRMQDFAPLSRTRVRRGMNEQASAWMSAVDGLPAIHKRLRRVAILNRPALDVIRGEDTENTLFYLDPPYLHSTRTTTGEYLHEMTAAQHEELLMALQVVKGKFLLSGYDSELYQSYERTNGWHRTAFELPNNSASGKTKQKRTEVVWTNFPPRGADSLGADGTTPSRLPDVAAGTARGLGSKGKAALPAAPSVPNGAASLTPGGAEGAEK